jgi:type II secretory pathway pseudopilin PulG
MIELMIIVLIIGVLAAVAIPSYLRYIRRSKTIEATMNLRKLFDSSVAYFSAERGGSGGATVGNAFPDSFGPSPGASATVACCGQKGDKCVPSPTNFDSPTWAALNFSVDDPFYFVYQYASSGTDSSAKFTASAYGDLDCDSIQSTYARGGSVMSDRAVSGGSLFSKNDVE